MKTFDIVLLITFILLAACASAPQAAPATNAPQSLSGSLKQPTSTPDNQAGGTASGGDSLQAETEPQDEDFPQPEVQWDPDPETQVVSATFCCGLASELLKNNYLPQAQIYGDGRIIWTLEASDGKRNVMQGRLTSEQMAGLLQSAVNAGFFGWDELYTDPLSPSDLPSQCLSIQLVDQSRRVCEYYQGAPPAFHDLYDRLAQGAGASGTPYTPENGYLTAYPIDKPDGPAQTWDADGLGLSLAQAVSGAWVEGPALEKAWELVNDSPWGGITQEGEAFYQITLQIPVVSMYQPPMP